MIFLIKIKSKLEKGAQDRKKIEKGAQQYFSSESTLYRTLIEFLHFVYSQIINDQPCFRMNAQCTFRPFHFNFNFPV